MAGEEAVSPAAKPETPEDRVSHVFFEEGSDAEDGGGGGEEKAKEEKADAKWKKTVGEGSLESGSIGEKASGYSIL